MKIRFCLFWMPLTRPSLSKAFKSQASLSLFTGYVERIQKFSPCEIGGATELEGAAPGKKLWLCDPSSGSRMLTSEQVAEELGKYRDSAIREWSIAIGPADGFQSADLKAHAVDFRWSFGPLTLPHELAAIVSAEQIYRAWAILHRLPYHRHTSTSKGG